METVATIIASGAALIFSIISFRRSHRTSIRPILIFSNNHLHTDSTTTWFVENVGSGPALNVILCGGVSRHKLNEDEATILPAMAVGAKESLMFISKRNYFIAKYQDVYGNSYTTICSDNRNLLHESDNYPNLVPKRTLYDIRMAYSNLERER